MLWWNNNPHNSHLQSRVYRSISSTSRDPRDPDVNIPQGTDSGILPSKQARCWWGRSLGDEESHSPMQISTKQAAKYNGKFWKRCRIWSSGYKNIFFLANGSNYKQGTWWMRMWSHQASWHSRCFKREWFVYQRIKRGPEENGWNSPVFLKNDLFLILLCGVKCEGNVSYCGSILSIYLPIYP